MDLRLSQNFSLATIVASSSSALCCKRTSNHDKQYLVPHMGSDVRVCVVVCGRHTTCACVEVMCACVEVMCACVEVMCAPVEVTCMHVWCDIPCVHPIHLLSLQVQFSCSKIRR